MWLGATLPSRCISLAQHGSAPSPRRHSAWPCGLLSLGSTFPPTRPRQPCPPTSAGVASCPRRRWPTVVALATSNALASRSRWIGTMPPNNTMPPPSPSSSCPPRSPSRTPATAAPWSSTPAARANPASARSSPMPNTSSPSSTPPGPPAGALTSCPSTPAASTTPPPLCLASPMPATSRPGCRGPSMSACCGTVTASLVWSGPAPLPWAPAAPPPAAKLTSCPTSTRPRWSRTWSTSSRAKASGGQRKPRGCSAWAIRFANRQVTTPGKRRSNFGA